MTNEVGGARTVRVTPSQVDAAKMIIQRDLAEGRGTPEAIRMIAGIQTDSRPRTVGRTWVVDASSAVVIRTRDYDRIIESLEGSTHTGWADLWLAGVGAGLSLAGSALVAAFTLPSNLRGARDVLWALVGVGATILSLCLVAYVSQRREREAEIGKLENDLTVHRPRISAPLAETAESGGRSA